MNNIQPILVSGAMTWVIILTLTAGCATKNDTVAQAEKTEKNRPGIAETKAIAEEGFIYGLPIVMNYAVIYGPRIHDRDQPIPEPGEHTMDLPTIKRLSST